MKRKYKKELQSIYKMSLANDLESKDLAISLFWTSEYVQDNNIIPKLRLCMFEENESLKESVGFYLSKNNPSRYKNFSSILDDLIHDKVCFINEIPN